MKHRSVRWNLFAGLLAMVFVTVASGQTMLLTGGNEGLWLVRISAEDSTYDVLAKTIDKPWKWIEHGAGGRPTSLAASDIQLHLLFSKPAGYVIYDFKTRQAGRGRNPQHKLWPIEASRVVLCEAGQIRTSERVGSTVLAVVPRAAALTADSPQPEQQRGEDRHKLTRLGVFLKDGDSWSHLTDHPEPQEFGKEDRLLTTVVDGALFVMLSNPQGQRNRLAAYHSGTWRDIPLKGWPKRSDAIGLLSIGRKLIAVVSVPKPAGLKAGESPEVELRLAVYDRDKQTFLFQPIAIGGQPATWDANAPLLTASFADHVAILWGDDKLLKMATCDLNGQVPAVTEVDALRLGPADASGVRVLDIFQWALVFAILVPMFAFGPREPFKPFALLPTMRPGDLIKRGLAGLIDLVPCGLISMAVFQIEPISYEQMRELSEQRIIPTSLAYAVVATLLLHAAYAILMEYRFGATIGKMLFKLRVVGDEGAKPGIRQILLRNLVRIFSLSWLFGPPLMITLQILTRNRQRLGDILAKTAVIDTAFKPSDELSGEPHEQPADEDNPEV